MKGPWRALLFLAVLLPSLARGGDAGLAHALGAQALLGSERWSRVLRIENTAKGSLYPAETHALVFEFAGILWFYADVNGTQSLSLHGGRLAEEKADLGRLLRAIEPGFVRHTVVDPPPETVPAAPPNACFLASVAALRTVLARGELIEQARLLSYYVDVAGGRIGHTLLTYATARGAFAIDPAVSPAPVSVSRALVADGRALAQHLRGGAVAAVRWVPAPCRPDHLLAATAGGDASRSIR